MGSVENESDANFENIKKISTLKSVDSHYSIRSGTEEIKGTQQSNSYREGGAAASKTFSKSMVRAIKD